MDEEAAWCRVHDGCDLFLEVASYIAMFDVTVVPLNVSDFCRDTEECGALRFLCWLSSDLAIDVKDNRHQPY